MPQVDPKFTFWFGVWTNLLVFVAGYGVDHAPAVIQQYAPSVQWIVGMFAQGNGIILTALVGISSSKVGPLVNIPANMVKPLILAAVILGGLFAFTGDARAQVKLKSLGQIQQDIATATGSSASTSAPRSSSIDGAVQSFSEGVQKIEKALVDKGIADLTAAITDATNHNDNISLPCWNANLKLLQSLPSQWETPPPSPIGIALGIQIQRDLLNAITGSDASSLKVACAALWGDQLKIVANLGALIGVRIATGGLF